MRRIFAAVLCTVAFLGCGPRGPKTHPVEGRIELAEGDVASLAGSTIEAALDADPTVRAAGTVEADGSFRLETLQAGEIRKGAVAGTYKVRLVLIDDDRAARRRAAQAVHPNALKFESSGLTLEVPAKGDVRLAVPARR